MGAIRQPCMECGKPTNATRCERHTTQHNQKKNRLQTIERKGVRGYGPGWKQRSAFVRATATRCHICGEGPRANDPWQADHIIPIQHGGSDGPVAATHRSCNIAKGNRTRHQKPQPTHTGRSRAGTPRPAADTETTGSSSAHE